MGFPRDHGIQFHALYTEVAQEDPERPFKNRARRAGGRLTLGKGQDRFRVQRR